MPMNSCTRSEGATDGARTQDATGIGHDLECSRRVVATDPADSSRIRPTRHHGATARRSAPGARRHHLPHAHRLSVESSAASVRRRQQRASYVSALGATRCTRPIVGDLDRTLRRTARRGLEVAGCRQRHGQGAFWGDDVGPNPTDRAKNGVKRSILVEADGGPLAVVVAGANVHDAKLLANTLDAIVVERPEPTPQSPQHLCLDKGYDNPSGREATADHEYVPHIRQIGEEKRTPRRRKRHPVRRWVVERTLAWLSKCRGILVRYEKKACNYLGALKLACALLWFRRLWRLVVLR